MKPRLNRYIFILILIIAATVFRAFYFEKISSKALYDFDEARYAEIAKNILSTGNWLIPLSGSPDDFQQITEAVSAGGGELHPYFWKPPLHPIVIAITYMVFGQNEFAVRIPSLLFSLLSLIIVYLIALKIFSNSLSKYSIALIATSLLASTGNFSFISSQGIADAQLLFFSLAAVYCLLFSKPKIILSAIFLSLAFLTKSFAIFWIYPLSIGILHHRQQINFRCLIFWIVPQFLIIFPWHIFMFLNYGKNFIDGYVIANTLNRGNGMQNNAAPIYWYLRYAFDQWITYILVIPLLIIPFVKSYSRNKDRYIFLITWILTVLIPFSLIKSKVWWYIFPLWVPFCILLASLVAIQLSRFKKITLFLLVVILLTVNYLTVRQSLQRTDWNNNIKILASRHPKLHSLVAYKIPYESALYYFDTGEISRDLTEDIKYVITNRDYVSELDASGEWYRLDSLDGVYLLSR